MPLPSLSTLSWAQDRSLGLNSFKLRGNVATTKAQREGRKLSPKRETITLRNPSYLRLLVHTHPFLQPLSVNQPLLTLLKDPYFHHPALFGAKCNQKDDAGAAVQFTVLPRLQALAWQLRSLQKKTLFTRNKSRPIVHLWASSSKYYRSDCICMANGPFRYYYLRRHKSEQLNCLENSLCLIQDITRS